MVSTGFICPSIVFAGNLLPSHYFLGTLLTSETDRNSYDLLPLQMIMHRQSTCVDVSRASPTNTELYVGWLRMRSGYQCALCCGRSDGVVGV